MQISEERLKEFKKIWKDTTGKDISDKEALEHATKLLRFVEIIYKPMTEKDYKKYSKEKKLTE